MWRFDFAFPKIFLAIEIQGYGKGHASYTSMDKDYKKHNEAVRCGWSILYFMGHQLTDETIEHTIKYVISTINLRTGGAPIELPVQPPSIKDLFAEMRKKHGLE